jgi:hypothetical protein
LMTNAPTATQPAKRATPAAALTPADSSPKFQPLTWA